MSHVGVLNAIILTFFAASGLAHGNVSNNEDGLRRQDLVNAYHRQFLRLKDHPLPDPSLPGRHDGLICCIRVIEASVIANVSTGTLDLKPGQSYYIPERDGHTLDFYQQFPCTAAAENWEFNEDGALQAPAPNFWTSYHQCWAYCPGWALTPPDAYGLWLRPLVVIVLPSVVFSMIMPRRRQIDAPEWTKQRLPDLPESWLRCLPQSFLVRLITQKLLLLVFQPTIRLVAACVCAFSAAAVSGIDTLLWMSIAFSMAGPSLASGACEAILDAEMLGFLETNNHITVRERAHALLTMLIGNLRGEPAWIRSCDYIRMIEIPNGGAAAPPLAGDFPITSAARIDSGTTLASSIFLHPSPQESRTMSIDDLKRRLSLMIALQQDFGTVAGAPLLFYVVGFSYTVYEAHKLLGDNPTSHQLAMAMLWMVIPHVGIMSYLLLSGNNPTIWRAVFGSNLDSPASILLGGRPGDHSGKNNHRQSFLAHKHTQQLLDHVYIPTYPDCPYEPAWMWDRGWTKAEWIRKLARNPGYANLRFPLHRRVLERGPFGRTLFFSAATGFLLEFIPAFIAGLVRCVTFSIYLPTWLFFNTAGSLLFCDSYTTPTVGLGCRSIMFMTYGLSQTVLILLWLADGWFWRADLLTARHAPRHSRSITGSAASALWWIMFGLAIAAGFASSVVGTLAVLVGVFNTCFCSILAKYWFDVDHPDALISWNSANSEQIKMAETWWLGSGIAGTVLLVVIACVGWWYQTNLRRRFNALVGRIDAQTAASARPCELMPWPGT